LWTPFGFRRSAQMWQPLDMPRHLTGDASGWRNAVAGGAAAADRLQPLAFCQARHAEITPHLGEAAEVVVFRRLQPRAPKSMSWVVAGMAASSGLGPPATLTESSAPAGTNRPQRDRPTGESGGGADGNSRPKRANR